MNDFLLGKAYHLLKKVAKGDDELAAEAGLWVMQYLGANTFCEVCAMDKVVCHHETTPTEQK